ncbi:MAG: phosphohydrolase, partial [Ardenticatenaceae bacterium]
MDVEWAQQLAESLLARSLPCRWRHVQGVGAWAAEISARLDGVDDALVASAWLHDIGYAPDLVMTGFHPLDG